MGACVQCPKDVITEHDEPKSVGSFVAFSTPGTCFLTKVDGPALWPKAMGVTLRDSSCRVCGSVWPTGRIESGTVGLVGNEMHQKRGLRAQNSGEPLQIYSCTLTV